MLQEQGTLHITSIVRSVDVSYAYFLTKAQHEDEVQQLRCHICVWQGSGLLLDITYCLEPVKKYHSVQQHPATTYTVTIVV
jgi:hypothetical protein